MNACTLATPVNVVSAFGGKITASSTSTTGTGAQLCKFVVANGRAAKNLTISFSTHKPVSAADFNAGRTSAVKAGAVPVSGVGNGAYYVRSSTTLQFLAGNTGGFVQVQAPMAAGSAAASLQSGATSLAKAIVASL